MGLWKRLCEVGAWDRRGLDTASQDVLSSPVPFVPVNCVHLFQVSLWEDTLHGASATQFCCWVSNLPHHTPKKPSLAYTCLAKTTRVSLVTWSEFEFSLTSSWLRSTQNNRGSSGKCKTTSSDKKYEGLDRLRNWCNLLLWHPKTKVHLSNAAKP